MSHVKNSFLFNWRHLLETLLCLAGNVQARHLVLESKIKANYFFKSNSNITIEHSWKYGLGTTNEKEYGVNEGYQNITL